MSPCSPGVDGASLTPGTPSRQVRTILPRTEITLREGRSDMAMFVHSPRGGMLPRVLKSLMVQMLVQIELVSEECLCNQ